MKKSRTLRAIAGLAALMTGLTLFVPVAAQQQLIVSSGTTVPSSAGEPGELTVKVDEPGAKISPTLYGLMTEEINYSYDGGLYGELIWNRIFKDVGGGGAPQGWSVYRAGVGTAAEREGGEGATPGTGTIAIDTHDPVNNTALTNSLRLDITTPGSGVGVANDGYWGIPVKPNWQYKASFYARAGNDFSGPLTAAIVGNDGKVLASATVPSVGAEWKRYAVTLKTGQVQETADTKFVISGNHKGSVWFSLVSLFPPTFHDRPNGFRADLMQLLDEMHPAFLRFPGGNYLEGANVENRFNWKATIGPYEERPTHLSPWNYRSSDGMGLLEFLLWCEDLKIEPVVAVYAGLHIDRGARILTGDELKPHVQDALDEIEYVMGDVTTAWGARRAKDGHPQPFKLTCVEIGNEDNINNGRPSYDGRFAMFYAAIKTKYPHLQVIASAPGLLTTQTPDLVDEHYYMSIPQALTRAHMYDSRPRTGPKIFVGEWATRVGNPTPQLSAAVADAAFLTGLERNADLVVMSCYAPLFVNINPGGMQWPTDLIGYNTLQSYGSPSYYVQKMFYNNRGDTVLPVQLKPQIPPTVPPRPATATAPATALVAATTTGPGTTAATGRGRGRGGPPAPLPPTDTLFASASRDTDSGAVILKVANVVAMPQRMQIRLQGVQQVDGDAVGELLTGAPTDVNTVAEPLLIAPRKITIAVAGPVFVHEFPGNSVTVVRLKVK